MIFHYHLEKYSREVCCHAHALAINVVNNFNYFIAQCSFVVTSDVSNLSTNRLRSIQKYDTPVVGLDYVYSCVEGGVLLPVDDYELDTSTPPAFSPPLTLICTPQGTMPCRQ